MSEIYETCRLPLTAERLKRLERAEVTHARYQNLFPSLQSWKWFRRTRKNRLRAQGALVETTAGDLIDPHIFDAMLPSLLKLAHDADAA